MILVCKTKPKVVGAAAAAELMLQLLQGAGEHATKCCSDACKTEPWSGQATEPNQKGMYTTHTLQGTMLACQFCTHMVQMHT
jgi:hypothetical protein